MNLKQDGYPSDTAAFSSKYVTGFKYDGVHDDIIETLNGFISDYNIDTRLLCRMWFFRNNDDEDFKVNGKHICDTGYGVHTRYDKLYFTAKNEKDVLAELFKYHTENPIVRIYDTLDAWRSKEKVQAILNNSYVKSLIAKSQQDYADMELLIQASNI